LRYHLKLGVITKKKVLTIRKTLFSKCENILWKFIHKKRGKTPKNGFVFRFAEYVLCYIIQDTSILILENNENIYCDPLSLPPPTPVHPSVRAETNNFAKPFGPLQVRVPHVDNHDIETLTLLFLCAVSVAHFRLIVERVKISKKIVIF
jgi:hypothetical protein